MYGIWYLVNCARYYQDVEDLYARASKHFGDSAMLSVFVAQYYNVYRSNTRVEQMYLTEAEVLWM